MSKLPTFPYLFDEAKTISISNLRKMGYLKPQTLVSGKLTWNINGIEAGNIGFTVKIDDHRTVLFLDYLYNGKPYKYEISLVFVPSNLGKGKVWYFICPYTKKRCRKLHLISDRFIHRSALPGGMYECQTRSRSWRDWKKIFDSEFDIEKCNDEISSKYFKKYYNGKPTKRYLKLWTRLSQF